MSILKEDVYNLRIRLMVKIPKEIWRGQNVQVILSFILTTSLKDWHSGLGPGVASGTPMIVLKLSRQRTFKAMP